MKAEESKFDEIQKALALKKHEQPSARYFKGFNHEVIDRINSPEPTQPTTWHERLGWGEDARPFWLCGLGIVVCAVLVMTLIAALKVEKPGDTLRTKIEDPTAMGAAPGNASESGTLPGYPSLPIEGAGQGNLTPVLAPGNENASFLIRTQQHVNP